MTPLEQAQPFWRVHEGGAPGLTTLERAALERDVAPEGFMAHGQEVFRRLGRGMVAFGAASGLVAIVAALALVYAWLAEASIDAGTPLVFALFGCVFPLAMGAGFLRSSSPGKVLALHRRDGVVTSKRGQLPAHGSGVGPIEYRVVLDGSLELRVMLTGRAMWKALEEGGTYRLWHTPHPGVCIVYAEPVPSS